MGPYVGHYQPCYATPPPEAGYYYNLFGGNPLEDQYMTTDTYAGAFEDEFHHGCSCSIQ